MAPDQGFCPVCHGTTRVPATGPYKKSIYGYDPDSDTFSCDNCGGQTMSGHATGLVPLRKDGTPCKHELNVEYAGRCYHLYTCKHCGFHYDIDSGD